MICFHNPEIQKKIHNRLNKIIQNNRLSHAYLFYGPEGSGKEAIAIEFAKAINCKHNSIRPCNTCDSCRKIAQLNHPDIQFIFPTSKAWANQEITERLRKKSENPFVRVNFGGNTTIPIDRIRELQSQAKYGNYEAEKRVYIICDAEQMSRESANAFLKLLEEPPSNLIIILITTAENVLLDTIRSRCQRIYFPKLSYKEAANIVQRISNYHGDSEQIVHIYQANLKEIFYNLDREIDEKRNQVYTYLRAVAAGNPYLLLQTVEDITRTRDKNYLMDLMNLITLWFRDAFHSVILDQESEMVNMDFRDELNNFVKAFGGSNFEQIVSDVENAVRNLNQNVYPPLLFTVLGNQINKNLIRS